MFLSLGIIFILGIFGGLLFEKIKLPKLIFYLVLGVLLGPSILNLLDESLLAISSELRMIALVIILTRAGLSLDFKTLKQIGRPAILMCFLPAIFEIIGVTIFAPIILDIKVIEALLLGSVLAAVSPAVIVPRMIKLQNEKYGFKNSIPELVMAGASCDDIFVIVLFYSFKNLVAKNTFSPINLLEIPQSIILGLGLGLIGALIFIVINKIITFNKTFKVIMLLSISFLMIGIENLLKEYINISALIGIMFMSMLVLKYLKEDVEKIKKSYNNLWNYFEILLFVLVGCKLNLNYAFSFDGLLLVCLIFLALAFRTLGVILCLLCTNYSFREKIFIVISYLPKATVQASIGAIALQEGLPCGVVVLTGAVISILITAPIGAYLIDYLHPKLLEKEI